MRLCTCFFHYIYFNNTVKDFAQAGCASLLNPGLGRHPPFVVFMDSRPGKPMPDRETCAGTYRYLVCMRKGLAS